MTTDFGSNMWFPEDLRTLTRFRSCVICGWCRGLYLGYDYRRSETEARCSFVRALGYCDISCISARNTRDPEYSFDRESAVSVSVIIPTLNEEHSIATAIHHTRLLGPCEVIVVDGGSDDATLNRAVNADQCLTTRTGRTYQLNAGAAAASHDILLFLHADCRLDVGALEAIALCLDCQDVTGGCFRQRIDSEGIRYRMIERGNALRVRWLKWAYGDQGIFVRRSVFEDLGGFPELAFMEDLFFMKRLKRIGRFELLAPKIHVSARRWEQRGILRQTVRNWTLITLAHCGVSPNRLAKLYPLVR